MRTHKRWLLILWLVLGQLACMLLGLTWFIGRIERDVTSLLHQQVLADGDAPR